MTAIKSELFDFYGNDIVLIMANVCPLQQPILSEYADVTLPGPPEVLYSNMADRQVTLYLFQ